MSSNPSLFSRLRVTDVGELAEAVEPWDLEMAQLTGGDFSADLSLANVGNVLISRESWSQKVLAAGMTPADRLMVGIAGPRHGVIWRGTEALENDLVWGVGETEIEFLVRERGLHFALLFPAGMVERVLGGELRGALRGAAGVVRTDCDRARRLRGLIASAMAASKSASVDGELDGLAGQLCSNVLDILAGENVSADHLSARKSRQTCFRATRLAEDSATLPSVLQLAERAGVSLRVLELAFRETLQLSPHQFLTRLRLNRLHATLRRNGVDSTSVTAAMQELGFTELGRTARRYRELFEEKPSETLVVPQHRPKTTFGDVLDLRPTL